MLLPDSQLSQNVHPKKTYFSNKILHKIDPHTTSLEKRDNFTVLTKLCVLKLVQSDSVSIIAIPSNRLVWKTFVLVLFVIIQHHLVF